MKCREKNSDKEFLKVENTEYFWGKLKEMKVKVVLTSDKGIAISDFWSKYFAEFGEYLLVSNDGIIEVCGENEFNRRYEVINNNAYTFDEKINEAKRYLEQLIKDTEKLKSKLSKINMNFGNSKEILNFNKLMEDLLKDYAEAFKN